MKYRAIERVNNFWSYHNKIMCAIDNQNKSKNRNILEFIKHNDVDFERARKIIIAEINFYGYLGNASIYSFTLEQVFNFDKKKTYDFLLSSYGGFRKGEVNQAILNYGYLKNNYEKKKLERDIRKRVIDSPTLEISIAHTTL